MARGGGAIRPIAGGMVCAAPAGRTSSPAPPAAVIAATTAAPSLSATSGAAGAAGAGGTGSAEGGRRRQQGAEGARPHQTEATGVADLEMPGHGAARAGLLRRRPHSRPGWRRGARSPPRPRRRRRPPRRRAAVPVEQALHDALRGSQVARDLGPAPARGVQHQHGPGSRRQGLDRLGEGAQRAPPLVVLRRFGVHRDLGLGCGRAAAHEVERAAPHGGRRVRRGAGLVGGQRRRRRPAAPARPGTASSASAPAPARRATASSRGRPTVASRVSICSRCVPTVAP